MLSNVSDLPFLGRCHPWWYRAPQLGQAAWLVGNLYEGLVGMPQLLMYARPQRPAGLLAVGSPVRYFAPVAVLALGPTGITLAAGWRSGADRRLIMATAACLGSALGLSAYLILTVNLPLLAGNEALTASKRHELVTRWHRGNAARLVALAGASACYRACGRRS